MHNANGATVKKIMPKQHGTYGGGEGRSPFTNNVAEAADDSAAVGSRVINVDEDPKDKIGCAKRASFGREDVSVHNIGIIHQHISFLTHFRNIMHMCRTFVCQKRTKN